MNKKLNLWLNVSESILVGLMVIIGSYFYITESHFNVLANSFVVLGSMILVAALVSIELFLFYLLSKKYKIITIGYYFAIALIIALSNIVVPFFGIVLLIASNIAKNYYRIEKNDLVYEKEQLYEVCDLFGIKIKKEKKKRTAISKAKKTVKATVTKKQTVPTKKVTKSYA